VGFAVKNNSIAGVDFNYSNSSSKKFLNYGDYKSTNWAIGIFGRKYVPIIKSLYFFGQTNLNYNHYSNETPSSGNNSYFSNTTQKTVEASLYPGLTFNISKSFYVETAFPVLIEIGYSQSTNTSNPYGTTITTNDKGAFFNSELTNSNYLSFGLRFIIPKK
jgi:Autotransporter beta-domain